MNGPYIDLFLKNFFKIGFVILVSVLFFYILIPFMIAIILGGILAMALAPFVDFFIKKGLSRRASIVIFTLILAIIGLIPIVAFFIRGSQMISNLMHESNLAQLSLKLTSSMDKLIEKICTLYGIEKTLVESKFNALISSIGSSLSSTFSNFITDLPFILMIGFITLLSIYFFLRESDKIRILFDRYFQFSKENSDNFVHKLKVCCREVFFSNIITGLLQATIVTIGSIVFDVGDFFLVFFITFIVSFIPIIGASPIAALLAIVCFMDSRIGPGVGMMIIAAVTGIADNIIRPFLGSIGTVEVDPFIGLMAVIGGVIMFGLPGLFIGPLVASVSFGVLPIIVDEYFPP